MGIAFGLTTGLTSHYWYKFLDAWIVGSGMKVVAKKIACDQFIFGPIMTATAFGADQLLSKKKDDTPSLMTKSKQILLTY